MIELRLRKGVELSDLTKRLRKIVRIALNKAGQSYVESVKEYVKERKPWQVRTGALLQSISYSEIEEGKILVVGESERVKYGRFLEFGTKPYIIKPRKRKALKNPTEEGYIIRKAVRHPGIKARPWFFRKEHIQRAKEAFEKAVGDELHND